MILAPVVAPLHGRFHLSDVTDTAAGQQRVLLAQSRLPGTAVIRGHCRDGRGGQPAPARHRARAGRVPRMEGNAVSSATTAQIIQ